MQVIKTFCDVCSTECKDRGGANQATIKWVSGEALDIHICDSCKETLHAKLAPIKVNSYHTHKEEQLGFFRKMLRAVRDK